MQINSIQNYKTHPSFEKRIVDKENMNPEQKDLYDNFVDERLYSESFASISSKLGSEGIDIYVKPLKEDSLKLILKKGDEVVKNKDGKPIVAYLIPDNLNAGIIEKFNDFQAACRRVISSKLVENPISKDDIIPTHKRELDVAEEIFLKDLKAED